MCLCVGLYVFIRLALSPLHGSRRAWQERSCAGLWENALLIESPLDDKAAISYTQQRRRAEGEARGEKNREREETEVKRCENRWLREREKQSKRESGLGQSSDKGGEADHVRDI